MSNANGTNPSEVITLNSIKNRSNQLASKINKLTDTLMSNIQTAEELHIVGENVIESVEEKTEDTNLYASDIQPIELLNLQNLLDDFKYIRDSLRETSDNARRILSQTATEITDGSGDLGDDVTPTELIVGYATLNKALTDNMKMYIQAYKEISNIILNIDKVKNSNAVKNSFGEMKGDIVQNNYYVADNEDSDKTADVVKTISTTDIIKSLRAKESS